MTAIAQSAIAVRGAARRVRRPRRLDLSGALLTTVVPLPLVLARALERSGRFDQVWFHLSAATAEEARRSLELHLWLTKLACLVPLGAMVGGLALMALAARQQGRTPLRERDGMMGGLALLCWAVPLVLYMILP